MPVDRGAIDAQLREIGESDRWWEQREFRDLPHILHGDERLRGMVIGRLLGPRRPRLRPAGRWLIIATDQRLICLKQERFARKQIEVTPAQIVRLLPSSRLRSYQFLLQTPQWSYRIRVRKEDAFRFAAALEALRPTAQAQAQLDSVERTWLPGLSALPGVRRLIPGSAGPAPDFATHEHVARVEAEVDRLQHDVERLQQQVAFLEDLLQKRAEEAMLQR